MEEQTTKRGAAALTVAVLALCLGFGLAPDAGAGTRLWAVGDGGVSDRGDEAMASRVASLGIDRLLYLGDVYETGTAREYATNYASSWGRFKRVTSPTPGNHEWGNREQGYDPYWGRRARGARGAHYYSFDLDGWHFVSLNSERGTEATSAQLRWLRRDLSRYGGSCTIAFWHRPRFDAGNHSDSKDVQPFWSALSGRASVVLNGHDHNYQRFKPVRGITQFIAGAGGRAPLDEVDGSDPRLATFEDASLGALRLGLGRSVLRYGYRLLDGTRPDSGRVRCRPHRPLVAVTQPVRDSVVRSGSKTLTGHARGFTGSLRISLVRRSAGGACQAYDGFGFRPSSCGSPLSFPLRDRGAWRLRLAGGRGLSRGLYVLTVRAKDPLGRGASATSRFEVR